MSLLDKIAKIEALIQRASTEGERHAAQLAKQRVLSKALEAEAQRPVEYYVPLQNPWKKRLFVAICAKYGFRTYRYRRQKYTTTQLKISKSMMDEILWPEFLRYAKILEELVEDILRNLIDKIHHVQEEEIEIAGEIGIKEGQQAW